MARVFKQNGIVVVEPLCIGHRSIVLQFR